MSVGEQSDGSAGNADWRKEVDELHQSLASKASLILARLHKGDRQAAEDLIKNGPLVMSDLLNLQKLQQSKLDDIRRCHDQWEAALSDRTGELGDLDDKVRQQQSKLDEQLQRAGYIETGLDKRQADADRIFASTQANADAAKRSLSEFAEQKTLLETLKVDLEAKERYQQSQTLALSEAKQELDQAVTSNQVEMRRLAEDRKIVSTDHKMVRAWRKYSEEKLANANAESRRAIEAKERLSKEIEDLKVQYRLLEQQYAKESRSLRIVTEANQELERQLQDSQESNGELERGMRNIHIAILPQKEEEIDSLSARLDNVEEQAEKSRKDLTSKIGKLNECLRGLKDNIRQKDTRLNQLEQDNASLQTENDGLRAVVDMCESEHSDIDQVRKQTQQLRIENAEYRPSKEDFAKAKSLQETSRTEYKKLEQEHNEAKQRYDDLKEQWDRDREMLDSQGARKDDVIQDLQNKYNSVESKLDKATNDYTAFVDMYNTLAHNANLGAQEKDAANEKVLRHEGTIRELCTQVQTLTAQLEGCQRSDTTVSQVQTPTAQLQSCQRSDTTVSRKRSHDGVDHGEEEGLSTDHDERMARIRGKTPELTAHASAATITPSDGFAFTISVNDIKLLNFSSDVLPNEILQTLRRRFQAWSSGTGVSWALMQSVATTRNCIEARMAKRKSLWVDGSEYACASCEKSWRICMVAYSPGRVVMLPRKAAEVEGRGSTDAKYWVKRLPVVVQA